MSVFAVDASWQEVAAYCNGLEQDLLRAEDAIPEGVAIFGAGPHGEAAYRYLKKIGATIVCFVDNAPLKQGALLDGIRVISPHELADTPALMVFIAARHAVLPIKRQMDEAGCHSVSFDAFFAGENIDRIRNVRDNLLCDDKSRLSYDGVLKAMLTGRESFCASIMEGNQFFALPEFVNVGTDSFVDAGAYVGDTIERFIWAHNGIFSQIYAFEPAEPQYKALLARTKRLAAEWAVAESTITCVQAGLADEDKEMVLPLNPRMLQTTSFSTLQDMEGTKVRLCSLDSYLAGRPATFIKADIEGMEMAMLRGARETIGKFKPKLALSIYHEPSDIYEIAEYVRRIVPEYTMAVRHHSPLLMDSVLYCWINE